MAKSLVDTFEAELAPLRLALGPDAYGHIKTALTTRIEQLETFKDLTMSTNPMTQGLVNIEEMIAPRSLWREARSILLRHAEEDYLSTSVLPGLHLMRFGWSSRPLVGMQSPA